MNGNRYYTSNDKCYSGLRIIKGTLFIKENFSEGKFNFRGNGTGGSAYKR